MEKVSSLPLLLARLVLMAQKIKRQSHPGKLFLKASTWKRVKGKEIFTLGLQVLVLIVKGYSVAVIQLLGKKRMVKN